MQRFFCKIPPQEEQLLSSRLSVRLRLGARAPRRSADEGPHCTGCCGETAAIKIRCARGWGVAGAESCCGVVEEGLLGGVDDENGGGAEGESHGGSCGNAGAGDFRPRRPGTGAERSKWLWRSYSSDFLLRRKLLLRRCRPGVFFDSSSVFQLSTMDAEFRSYNMVLMIHPQFSSILLSIFIAIAQFTGLQYVFSVNLGSSNILK